jgi:glycosyltransferase involved in cell wall biosynthesis
MSPLEAMACGVPVITANNSSLPEVVGKVGKMVSSKDTKALASAIKDYFDDYEAVAKKALAGGPKQAEKFNWAKSGQVFLDVVKEMQK